MKLSSHLPSWNCKGQRMLVRADLNVPIDNGTILNDNRLKAIQPTIDYILQQQGTVILATHLGRPQGVDPSLSTKQLMPWFKKNGYRINFASDFETARTDNSASIILLENLRFFAEEKDNSIAFAKQLAQCGTYFIQDAFGALHRTETSISLLPLQFPPEKRSIGFLVEKELEILNLILDNPKSPLTVIMGGKKLQDKIPVIKHLLSLADNILLCPALSFTFMKAQDKPIGKSLINNQLIPICKEIINNAQLMNKPIMIPVDFQVAQNAIDGPLSIVQQIGPQQYGISIGPKTAELYGKIIDQSKTIFFNGAIGFFERKDTLQGMKSILYAMASSSGTSIIGGGDSIAAAEQLGITGIDYYSTGGGSTLMYLSGKSLPGLKPFQP